MNAKRLVILHLILALSVGRLFDSHALLYPSGTFDFATLNTKRTLEANHIIVGEVTNVSSVFERESYSPSSLVTVQIDKDIKNEIERLENQEQNTQGQQVETERQEPGQRTVTFVQVGGPWRGGGWVKVAGFRVLKVGDYVFLRLMPVKTPFEHDGHTINSGTSSYATIYNTKKSGNNPND